MQYVVAFYDDDDDDDDDDDEPVQNLSSGFVEGSYAVVITTTKALDKIFPNCGWLYLLCEPIHHLGIVNNIGVIFATN